MTQRYSNIFKQLAFVIPSPCLDNFHVFILNNKISLGFCYLITKPMRLLTLSINPTFLMRSNHFKEFEMDKKQVMDLRSELLDSRFGTKSIS
ncbi:hypothetical protein ACTE87_001621, partial [Escherichia albertii]